MLKLIQERMGIGVWLCFDGSMVLTEEFCALHFMGGFGKLGATVFFAAPLGLQDWRRSRTRFG